MVSSRYYTVSAFTLGSIQALIGFAQNRLAARGIHELREPETECYPESGGNTGPVRVLYGHA